MVSPSRTTPDPEPHAPVPRPRLPGRRTHLLDELRFRLTDPRVGAALLAVVAIAAGVVWYVSSARSAEPPPAAPVADDVTTDSTDDGQSAETADDGPVTVHVAGAVASPGVVELAAGTRVIDAIEAVGGARPDGDLDRLNLAAALVDGQRVLVPVVGQPLPPGESGSSDGSGAAEGGPLDLNLATQDQLDELPGIGPVLAQAILDEREKRGGFQSVDDLKGVRGIGEQRFADIRDLVTVG